MDTIPKKNTRKRREIISWGVLTAFAITVGNFFGRSSAKKGDKPVKLIMADGTLVEVERRHIPKSKRPGKISNANLKQWMKNGKA